SNITTPPEERHPVLTYVGPYDEKQVSAAINRELLRDGQIFFIHNRVESIEAVAERIKKLVPGIKIGIAHGQMNERVLEEVILAFWNREFDLLLCTTIIESGIDIPNANTLIVDRSDLFGLSQLHQLRGRVGRSRERAYAYFLYPTEQPITELAHDRLTTIATNTDLGAGMQVALKDLEIRGAGNLLGGEQSGHIAEVGFDLYMRMVADAVDEFKTGYFDEKRIADAQNDEALAEISGELIDRFGPIPEAAQELMAVASLRLFAKRLGLTDVSISGKNLRLTPVALPESAQIKLSRIYPGSIYKNATQILLVARPATPNWIESASVGDTSTLTWVNSVLRELIEPIKLRSGS
ncbi:MAG: transcription-repair coupling factor, partial [Actinobacteria bacterium]|nr:transcription-repair coupling factor [Actinomycetota bacterium]